ncbi:LutC/YkgG family protein [Campylobacter pinnipediorum]|uniref:LutC/YkgG family protein n=1 Tax=Campylobacter pinnipediorum TaxID=1965231 RepID=UPI00084D11D0|nr:lactate utilization protein C [Campylobacter pinnipediorum]AQW83041.1 NAD-independent L-lactate dehydrogenase LldEFG, subunit LldG [Campylobacter pinnipediorum subsp. pinnipediorum]OPA78253.1 hypothetical protein BFG05_03330 [Campylobacter pinnipediorum subsp. pinnipediorum]
MSKEEILHRIRSGKHNMQMIDDAPTADPVQFIKRDPSGDMYKEFIDRITENRSIVVETTEDKLAEEINGIIKKEGAKHLIYSDEKLPFDAETLDIEKKFKFDKPIEQFKQQIFDFDMSVISARYAVSSHGTCCIASSKTQPRMMSLSPKICVMLVKKDTIVKSLSEALHKVKEEEGGRLPTNTIFITGPSRTADIELQTIIGVHGSQIAYVIVY